MEVADSIEEVKTTCRYCNRKAVFNLRHNAKEEAIIDGPTVLLGDEEFYSPTCYPCYHEKITAAKEKLKAQQKAAADVAPVNAISEIQQQLCNKKNPTRLFLMETAKAGFSVFRLK